MHYLTCLLPLWLLGCATSASGTKPVDSVTRASSRAMSAAAMTLDALPLPERSLKLPLAADSTTSLFQLVAEFERICDVHFLIGPDTRASLEQAQVGLLGKLEAPPQDAWATFETMLVQAGFVLALAEPATTKLVRIEQAHGPRRDQLRDGAVLIDAAELPAWAARHPGFLVTCVIEAQSVDPRQLATAMRGILTDGNTQTVLAAGNSNALIATGLTRQVHALATAVARIEALGVRAQAEQPAAARTAVEPEKQPK